MAASFRWAVALVFTTLVLGGCGDGGGSPRAEPGSETSGLIDVGTGCAQSDLCGGEIGSAVGPVTVPAAVPGGTVTVLTHDGLRDTLDPSAVSAPDVLSIERGLLARSLTQYRYDPATPRTVLVPDLATDLGSHNDDYTVWDYTIRSTARFEDGRPVTAADVARGVRRCLRATRPTGPCGDYAHVYIRSVVAGPGRRVRFLMTQPFPDLPYLAAFPEIGPLPAGDARPRHPLATGPYEISSYDPGTRLVLVRNHQWDPRSDPGRTQYPERYVFRAGVPSATIARALLRDVGADQTTLTYDHLSARAWRDLTRSAPDRAVPGAEPCTTYVAPDNRTIRRPKVRRALALAYPYRPMVLLAGGIPGVTALPATNLVPPGTAGRTVYREPGGSAFRTRPRAARALLRQAQALGAEIRFAFDRDVPRSVREKDALVRALAAGGFRPMPQRRPGRVDLRTTTRCGDWPSGSDWVPALFGSTPPNLAAFSEPSVDRALTHIRAFPLDKQGAGYDLVEHRVLRRWFPAFPVSYGGVDMARGSRVAGMADDASLGMPTWQRLSVTP